VAVTAPPPKAIRNQVRDHLAKLMRGIHRKPLRDLSDPAVVRSEVRRILNSGCVNPKATPGVPFDLLAKTKADIINLYPDEIVDSATELLICWQKPRSFWEAASIDQKIKDRFTYPTSCKIKQEPHKAEKLQQERYRIFFAMSMVMEVATRVLYQDLILEEADHWRQLPVKPGIGFTDDMIADMFHKIYCYQDDSKVDNDSSGFDWSVFLWLMDLVDDATIMACQADENRANMMRNCTLSAFDSPWMLSDGTLLEVTATTSAVDICLEAAMGVEAWSSLTEEEKTYLRTYYSKFVERSGDYRTARQNSWGRISISLLAGIMKGSRIEDLWAETMGDDCVESPHERDYTVLGFRITDLHRTQRGEPFEFCSHIICADGRGKLIPWSKTFYRLLSHQPSLEFFTQFQYEMRNNAELAWCEGILEKIGYFHRVYVPQCVLVGICTLPEKDFEEGLNTQLLWMTKGKGKSGNASASAVQRELAVVKHNLQVMESRHNALLKTQEPKRKRKARKNKGAVVLANKGPGMSNAILKHGSSVLPAVNTGERKRGTMQGISAWPLYEEFLRAMARPFDHNPVRCPMSYNDSPTFRTHVARTNVTISDFELLPGYSQTIFMLPGWASPNPINNAAGNVNATVVEPTYMLNPHVLDAFGTRWSTGPCNQTDANGATYMGACVFASAGAATTSSEFDATTYFGYPWDVSMPYTGIVGRGDSLRWRCTGISFRIVNITPEINRGGEVWTVQPTYSFADAVEVTPTFPVGAISYEPSLKAWGVCGETPMEVSAILKPKDLAYQQVLPNPGGSNPVLSSGPIQRGGNPAIMVCLTNTSSTAAQFYDIQIEYHWEVGGDAVFQIGNIATHLPAAKQAFEPTVSHLTNTSPTATPAPAVNYFMEAMNKGANFAAEAAKHPIVQRLGGAAVKGLVDSYLPGLGGVLSARAARIEHSRPLIEEVN